MSQTLAPEDLAALARAAAAGDQVAAKAVLGAVQDDVYELALRMLGHPADAEDAAQEILIIVLTHLGSFRAESSLSTWVWRIAVNHLARVRRGRREVVTFELLGERLRGGLRAGDDDSSDPEADALTHELRLRCTEAMLLSLDRDLRVAYILGDILQLSGADAADVLELDEAAYRKRLSRARSRLYEFLRHWCGVFRPENPCRCRGQFACAVERGLLARQDLDFSRQQTRPSRVRLARAADELSNLFEVAQVMHGPVSYAAPASLVTSLQGLLDSNRLALLQP